MTKKRKKFLKKKKEKIDFRYNINEYFKLLKKHRLIFWGLLIISIIVSIFSVTEKFLFKRIIDDGTKFIAGELIKNSFINILIIIGIVFIILHLFWAISNWLTFHLLIRFNSNVSFDLKRKYFNHILSLSHRFHTTHKTGSLISRVNRGSRAVETMNDIITFHFSPLLFQLIIVSASLAYFSVIPIIIIAITTIVFITYSFIIQQLQQTSKLLRNRAEDYEKGFIADIFTNIESIKYFGKEKLIKRLYKKTGIKTRKSQVKHGNYYRWFDGGQTIILGAGTFFLLFFPLIQFLNGEITLGTITFIYTVFGSVVGKMFGFVWGMRGFYRAMGDFQELFEYGKIEKEIKDKPNAKPLKIKKGEVEFRDIDFKYDKRKLFENFNLKIKPNEKVALVGHSGSGKTTLIKILYRLYDVQKGAILIDNQNIRDVTQESLREEMAVVPQEAILFDDTIYNNIKFSNPKANKEQIMKAIKFAQLDKIIDSFPKKEKTIVGERGVKLSGGEKQRVSIARAILANKKILVLDEATSSLDSETEYEIQKDLLKLLKGRTAIMIAHRLSTIMHADRIIVLKKGKIIQQGKHKDLIKKPGEYRKLWNLQKGGYIK